MNKYKEVKIKDTSEYVAGQDSDGGCYSYAATYTWDGSEYRVLYSTSSELGYCSGCGSFCDCNCAVERIDEVELEKIIKRSSEEEDLEVKITFQ